MTPVIRLGVVAAFDLGCVSGCSMHARPTPPAAPQQSLGVTVEAQDPALSAALLRVALVPSPAHHLAVADEYRRLQILDAAFDHLSAATRLDPRDAWREFEAALALDPNASFARENVCRLVGC